MILNRPIFLTLMLALTGCATPAPTATPTAHPTTAPPTASPTGVGTPIATASSGDLRLEIVSAHADPLQIRIAYVIHNLPPELLTDPTLENLTVDGSLDLRGPIGWSQMYSASQPGSAPGTVEGEIRYTQENLMEEGDTITVPVNVDVSLVQEPTLEISPAPSEEAIIITRDPVSIELQHSFNITLDLPVQGPFHNIDVGQTQTVNGVTMTLQGAWVSPSVVRVVFCPDLTLDYETWHYTLVGDFDGVEVQPVFRGHFEGMSYYCELYDYERPDSNPIDDLTFTIDRLRGNIMRPFTQDEVNDANEQLAGRGIVLTLDNATLSLQQIPDGMASSDAWDIAIDTLFPPIVGPWHFTVDLP